MGCAPSSPQDMDTLPLKAQCRTAFARCSTTENANANGFLTDEQLGQQQDAEGHDVVLCYPLGGTVFGLELQARYEKMDSVSLWTLDHFLSLPGSPLQANKSSSVRNGGSRAAPGLEIRPAPEQTGAAASPPNQMLSREVRLCRRGVVVLVTAGCTWDDGVLNCLRLTGRFLRPLVLVHCVQSCPLPALEEWPQDVRPLIAASGPPVKYLTQHSAEALRHMEQRMLAAAAPASASAAPPTVAVSVVAPAPAPVAAASGHCSCIHEALQGIPPQYRRRPQAPQSQPHGVSVSPAPQPKEQAQAQQQQAGQHQAGGGCQGEQQPGQDVAGGTAAAGLGPSLSLEALQASGSAVCRRAAQILGSWTGSGGCSPAAGGPGRVLGTSPSRCESPITTTLVEALVASQRPSSSSLPRNAGARRQPGARSATASISSCASVTGSQKSSRNPSPTPGRNRQQRQRPQTPQQPQCTQRAGGPPSAQAGGGCVRCVLRYRDACWATPVAFVCAQLEEDLGQLNVSLQPSAAAKQTQPEPRKAAAPAPVTVARAAARLNLQSPDGWGRARCRRPSQQQPEKRQALDSGGKGVGTSPAGAAAAAAAAAQPSLGRGPGPAAPCSSGGSSGRCSTSGCRAEVSTTSDSTFMASGGGASSPEPGGTNGAATGDDDLVAFSSPSLDDSSASPPVSGSVCDTRSRAAAAGTPGANRRASGTGTVTVGGGAVTPGPDPTAEAPWTALEAEANVTCVYFVSPGLSAPLGCLEEISSGLAQGRQVVLVVDGECCQRLPDYTPPGVTPHVWKAVKKLWQERLLYVPDYHTSFYGLIRQGILATAGAPT